MQVGFQGERGAFSEMAVRDFFPHGQACPYYSFEKVFAALHSGEIQHAVIPIENSLFGSVHVNYDLLRKFPAQILGERYLRIHHHLMAKAGTNLASIRKVYSHPQALGQCQDFLHEKIPQAENCPNYDTAGSAKRVAESTETGLAAIASRNAATEYGLEIIAENIESHHENFTRFLALAATEDTAAANATANKTSIVFSHKENIPGALFKSLAVFALRELDLFKIESRPLIGQPGQYVFYLDFSGSLSDQNTQKALVHLQELTNEMKVLGCYPAADIGKKRS